MRNTILFIVIVLFLIAVAVFSMSQKDSSTTDTKPLVPVSIRLSWVHQAQFAGFYWAKEKGLYEAEGLDVSFKQFDQGRDQAEELVSREVDFSVPSASEVLYARSQGKLIKAVAAVYQKSPYAFVARKETGIQSPLDFAGKRLGISGGGQEGRAVYRILMGAHGISDANISFVNLGFDTPDDVAKKNADVFDLYRTDQTYLLEQQGIAYNLITPEQSGFEVYGDVIAVSDDFIKSNPEIVRKFVRASMRGWAEAILPEHREEVLDIVRLYEDLLYKDRAYERYILEKSIPLIETPQGTALGDMDIAVWDKYYQAFLDGGVFKEPFNVQDAFTTEFLPV